MTTTEELTIILLDEINVCRELYVAADADEREYLKKKIIYLVGCLP